MGLSSKQVSSDHSLDWSQTFLESGKLELPKQPQTRRQQQNQQHPLSSEPLKCPRCGSTNTKFCYYNNYNKSQPRHFCKACKRHWTKGGTLRNVPVGGGRKNKRLKTTANATTTTTASKATATGGRNYGNLAHSQRDCHNSTLGCDALNDQENISDSILYRALISSSSSVQHDSNTINAFMGKNSTSNKNSFAAQDQQSLEFYSFSSLNSSFDAMIPCSFPCSNLVSLTNNGCDHYIGELDQLESSTITSSTVIPTTRSSTNAFFSESWQAPITMSTTNVMEEMPKYWNWNDIDPLVSADLNISWEDLDIKP
ncbi:hypothetical protein ACH5RR_015072 [Cinchona calisaya]|uniref:Dof zinc finger protein n=1 Tax=Cinchona calisaya TaxID=153742 RepID=A0ABD2ZSI6_9GENT